MYLPIRRIHLKQISAKDLSNDAYAMFLCILGVLFVIFCMKAYVVGTHLNLNFIVVYANQKGILNICLYKDIDNKYTGCNLKTT